MRIVLSVLLCMITFCGPSISHDTTSDPKDSPSSSQSPKHRSDDDLAWFICRMWKQHKMRVDEASYEARVTAAFLHRAISKAFDTAQFAANGNTRNLFSGKGPSSTSTVCDPLMNVFFGKDCDSIKLETAEFVDLFKRYKVAFKKQKDRPTSENSDCLAKAEKALNVSIGKTDIEELDRILERSQANKR